MKDPADRRLPTDGAPRRQLSLVDAVAICVGVIVGAGIYRSTPAIAAWAGSSAAMLGLWLAGGALSLLGALCYAELATGFPEEGGEYVYFNRALGRRVGFFFAWSELWVIRPGSIGAMAYVFAEYAQRLYALPLARYSHLAYAATAIVVLTAVNLGGVRAGARTQNVLTWSKVLGLAGVVLLGLAAPWLLPTATTPVEVVEPAAGGSSNLLLAMVFVLFAFGGWNDLSFVAAEVRQPQRNLLWALVLAVVGVTAIYLLLNLALLAGLGFAGVAGSNSVAADLLGRWFGPPGEAAISLLICLSCLGAISGMIFTGARVHYALGAEHRLFAWLGHWNRRWDGPLRSLLVQSAISLTLVATFGLNEQQFERLVLFTAPLFWFFMLLVSVAAVRLRRHPERAAGAYVAPLFPLAPAALAATACFMLYATLRYALSQEHVEGLWTLGVVALGVIVALIEGRRATSPP